MSGLWPIVRAELRVRRLQTALLGVVAMIATGLVSLAMTLWLTGNSQFYEVFSRVRGADLLVTVPAGRVGVGQIRATAAAGVPVFATGPWPDTEAVLDRGTAAGPYAVARIAGRADPGGPVDRITLSSGRWVRAPGEVVVSSVVAARLGVRPGDLAVAGAAPGRPALRVVGVAADLGSLISGVQRAWVLPAQVPSLAATDAEPGWEMAYRFVHRPSEDQVQAALDREFALISDQLPAASQPVLLETSHDLRNEFNRLLDGLNYTLIPFSVFALVAAGIIVFNILTGAILGSYRQIGIMKAVGLGPRHLVAVYLAVTLAPALAGSMVGAALGSGSALVVVAIAHSTFAVPGPSATAALAAAIAVVVVLAVIGLAALVSSARAARVDVHQALVFGSPAQRGGSRRWRLGGRISPTLVLGTRDVLARPLRAALTMAAVTLAVVTLIYALDARTTLALMDQDFHQAHGDLIVYRYGGFPDASLTATLNRLPQALAVVPSENLSIEIPDAGVQADAVAMGGDASRQGYALVSGRWFSGPGEAVVSQGFLNAVRLRPGDSFTATVLRAAQSSIRLHVVGVYLDIDGFARIVRFDWRTLPAAVAGSGPHLYHVRLQRGAPIGPAVAALQDNFGYHASAVGPSLLTSVIDLLGTGLPALLLAIGLAGVFHTMLLNARERAPLIAVLKAIGMTRRQVLTMVVVTGAGLGLLGAAAGLPLGIWLTHLTGSLLAHQYQVVFPSGWTSDPSPTTAVILLVCGVTLGVLGASLPAHTAARLPVAPLLRAE